MAGSRVLIAILAGTALIAPIVWSWSRPPEPPSAPPAVETDDRLAELRAELEEERERNRTLSGEVAFLRQQIEALAQAERAASAGEETEAPGAEEEEAFDLDLAGEKEKEEAWFDEEALRAAGAPPNEIERLRDYFNSSEMRLLELRHRATREGWLGKRRYFFELHKLRQALREELGDDDFDLLLYVSGRKNRVVVDGVLDHSPADGFGFETGDVILQYGDQRIFKGQELRRFTTTGRLGERVAVDVLRDGEVIRIYAERGPLGVKLKGARLLPEGRW